MTEIVPAVTEITARVATWDASGVIDAIRDHINAGDATHIKIDAYSAGEGLTIGFVDAAEVHQTNLRKDTAARIDVSIEPSGSISAPGNSTPTAPTGTSADWSGEGYWDTSYNAPDATSKAWIVELPDAFFVFLTQPSASAAQANGVHAGRIAFPINSDDAASYGQDGLGFLCGEMDIPSTASAPTNWIAYNSQSKIHWETGLWGVPYMLQTSDYRQGAQGSDGETYAPPTPFIFRCYLSASNGPVVGATKYLRTVNATNTPSTVRPSPTSNQGWLHFEDNTYAGSYTLIWDKTVTP